MKAQITAISTILFLSLFSLGAQNEDWREKVASQKVAFITQELDLSPEEAQNFWPVYNEHQEKKKELLSQYRTQDSDIENLSEKEAKEEIELHLEVQDLLAKYSKEYTLKYLDILSAKKVLALNESERNFRREMLQRIRERKRDNSPPMRRQKRRG